MSSLSTRDQFIHLNHHLMTSPLAAAVPALTPGGGAQCTDMLDTLFPDAGIDSAVDLYRVTLRNDSRTRETGLSSPFVCDSTFFPRKRGRSNAYNHCGYRSPVPVSCAARRCATALTPETEL